MEWHDIEADGRYTVRFSDLPYVPLAIPPTSPDNGELFIGKKLGGILRHGEWAWLARNSVLQIISLRNGQTISIYEFCESRGYESCCVKCVEEIFSNNPEIMLLAVVLESFRKPGGGCSYVAIYSVELSSVLNSIELNLHLSCVRFMDGTVCRRSLLQNFDGCLAVGSEEGVIVLLDLNMRKFLSSHNAVQEDKVGQCRIVDYSLPLAEIHHKFRQCQKDGIHFGLQMEVIESPCSIQCILPVDIILGVAIGLEDGRLVLYDLAELQIFYIALPNPEVAMSALVKMDFLEPPDDPRPCLYIWTLHENGANLHAVLHSLMYEKRLLEEDDNTYYESFQNSSVRLQLPLEATSSIALSCQAISTLSRHDEDDSNSLCAISWLSVLECKNKLLIFDLNQWYKEEMPFVLEYGKQPNYVAGYIFNEKSTGLHTLLNPNNITHFNSMQRFEEHFYPNSLSFEGLLLHTEGSYRYNWEGAQNRVINLMRSSNAAIFLEPNLYFNQIIHTRLMPQFIELNMNSTISRNAKYEILLSTALEHNCVSLLRDCAKSWIDGSFMGNFAASTGLSLSTLTEWIWKRATYVKIRCNDLCKNLFKNGRYPLDSREQKELSFITRQLKLLSDLLKEILVYAKKQIPERVWHDLENKHRSLCMASCYQDILLWLLNIGLLPEAYSHAGNVLTPYPYKRLREFYKNRRTFFAKINATFISKKSGSCKLLFIDSFIQRVCKGNILYEYWLENDGNGLYPPESLEAMLRIMLVPDLDYDNKCAILLYFFLDLNMAIDEEVYKDVVANFIKFPSVFKLSAPLIKTVQAFWNLDHEQYLAAIEEFISPFNKNQCYPQWQVELLIEVLLNQQANNLALRVLESQPSLISPRHKLNILLANELISEAFHFVRCKNEDALLENFFTCCLRNGQFGVIRDLALSQSEGLILQNILKKSHAPGAESLHFVYLLQKSKYIEAVSYMDELSNKAKSLKSSFQMETPNLVLSAFNTTMTPVTQGLTDVYFRIKNKIKKKEVENTSPVPLSCQLIKQNANSLLGGIYHSSALSAHFATYYWGEMEEKTTQPKHLLSTNNAPFLRKPQIDTNCLEYVGQNNISYPQAYKVIEKRTFVESGALNNEQEEFEISKNERKLNHKKKRRLIGEQIVDDLSHFMKLNKTSNCLSASEFTVGQEHTSELLEQTRNNSVDLLTKPVKRAAKESEDTAVLVPEIHGILKTHTPEPGQMQRLPVVEEEKNLRFKLSSADDSITQIYIEAIQSEGANKQIETAQKNKLTEATRRPSSYTGSPKFKQISRTISEDSNRSSVSSSNLSEENFYSPMSSQNNSKLDCSNLSSYISGPQPRKPLTRFSAELSEKSLTPESKIKTTDSSSISQSGHLEYSSVSKLAFKISAESSLDRLNTDRLGHTLTNDDYDKKDKDEAAYVTSNEMSSKSVRASSFNSKEEFIPTSSSCTSTFSHESFVRSKINEFLPQVSSSKVGTTPIIAAEETQPKTTKLSECSTVLGSLTTLESTSTCSNNAFAMCSTPSDKSESHIRPQKHTVEQKRQMLETTLSMSTYDFSILDSTSLKQTKSSSKNVTLTYESAKTDEYSGKENKEIECEEQLEENKDEIEQKKDRVIEIQKQLNKATHEEKYCCEFIVLSSSSSSSSRRSSSTSSPEKQNNDYVYKYSDNEREEKDDEVEHDDYVKDENSEIDENNESDIFNDDVHDDYDEDKDIDELSIEETDSSRCAEKDDVIQLIEDSSSDVRQQLQENYYGESDSEDVKIIEDEQSTFASENIVSEEAQKEIKFNTSIRIQENTNVYEINKPPSLEASELEKEKIDKNVSASITEVSTDNKSEAFKHEDVIDISSFHDIGEKQERINKQQRENKSCLKDSTPSETVVKSLNSKEYTENIGLIEAALKEQISLKIEYSTDDYEMEVSKQLGDISTSKEKTSNTIKEKSEIVVSTEAKSVPIETTEGLKIYEIDGTEVKSIADSSASMLSSRKQKSLIVSSALHMDIKLSESNAFNDKSTMQEKATGEPAEGLELTIEQHSEENEKKVGLKEKDEPKEKSDFIVKPIHIDFNIVNEVSTPRRNTRGISVPPQTTIESEEFSNLTPRIRRNVRANSLQPKYKIEDTETGKPYKGLKNKNSECTAVRATRGSSLPPGRFDHKIQTRRRSVLMDTVDEDDVISDSPSTRTRLKSHLNSMGSSIVDSADHLVRTKRTRRMSTSENQTEQPRTPKRTRRNSNTSQPEAYAAVGTPRTLRSHSVLSVQEEDSESIPDSPKPSSNKRIGMKRKTSKKEEPTTKSQEQIDHLSSKSDQSAASEDSYSSMRRLTRTQLAILEKSAVLSQTSTKYALAKEVDTIPPHLNKRTTKSRSTRSSNVNVDSDETESISSKLSTASSVTGTKRRVTRSSLKEKDDDDDGASVVSSYGSEKYQAHYRPKEKSSSNINLTAIPEDAPVETRKRGRQQ